MKKIKILTVTMMLFLSFSACQNKANVTEIPTIDIDNNGNEPQVDTLVSSEKMILENQLIPQDSVLKYYEYFKKNPVVAMLFSQNHNEKGFSEEEMSAFAISEYARVDSDFEYIQGTSQDKLDIITKKYFDTEVSNYETTYTTILETGNITATGWGPTPTIYILKEIFTTEIGSKRAILYTLDPTIGESMEYDEYLQRILNGQFNNLGEIGLVEIEFIEKTDEKGEYYLQFISAHSMGVATQPWIVYSNL